MNETQIKPVPSFFNGQSIPSVAKWAAARIQSTREEKMEIDGRSVEVRNWMFTGQMPIRAKVQTMQWDCPELGRQYVLNVNAQGGTFKGSRQTVTVCFSEYASKDGERLPV